MTPEMQTYKGGTSQEIRTQLTSFQRKYAQSWIPGLTLGLCSPLQAFQYIYIGSEGFNSFFGM